MLARSSLFPSPHLTHNSVLKQYQGHKLEVFVCDYLCVWKPTDRENPLNHMFVNYDGSKFTRVTCTLRIVKRESSSQRFDGIDYELESSVIKDVPLYLFPAKFFSFWFQIGVVSLVRCSSQFLSALSGRRRPIRNSLYRLQRKRQFKTEVPTHSCSAGRRSRSKPSMGRTGVLPWRADHILHVRCVRENNLVKNHPCIAALRATTTVNCVMVNLEDRRRNTFTIKAIIPMIP